MSTAIVQQINQISAANAGALHDLEQHITEYVGARLQPEMANALIQMVRSDLQRLDVGPALAAIVEQLDGKAA